MNQGRLCQRAAIVSAFLLAVEGACAGEGASIPSPTPMAAADLPIATNAHLEGDEGRTRFTIDVSRTVKLAAFTLADPYRVVVDVPQMAFQLASKRGESGHGLITAFRCGLVMPGRSRIVIDTKGPVRIENALVIDSIGRQPARMILDLVTVDRESFTRTLAIENLARRRSEAKNAERELSTRAGDHRPIIVLDPGHGGIDTGTAHRTGS
jgi:N-acetylmuramoyl-L-alanine amidase